MSSETPVTLCKPNRHGDIIRYVDAEIAPLVQALNDGGVETIASCSGHGKQQGSIVLGGNSCLVVFESYAAWKSLRARITELEQQVKDTDSLVVEQGKCIGNLTKEVKGLEAERDGLKEDLRGANLRELRGNIRRDDEEDELRNRIATATELLEIEGVV